MMPFPANGLRVKWHASRFERVFYRGGLRLPNSYGFWGIRRMASKRSILSEPEEETRRKGGIGNAVASNIPRYNIGKGEGSVAH